MNLLSKTGKPSGFAQNLVSNFAGTGWSFLAQIVCIPIYLRFLGVEAYGLIGFYLMLQTLLQVLDLGLSPTMNREMARYSAQPEKSAKARDLVRSLEVGYWLVGIIIGLVIFASAPLIARDWIHAGAISISTVTHAVMLMGVLSVFQWPVSFYQGALMGLGQQVQFNVFKVAMVTLNQGGSVLILWLISPTITAFLLWQVFAISIQALLIALLTWRALPISSSAARFDPQMIRQVWRFAAGMSGIAAIALILTQLDKVVISRLLSLRIFAYYTLAWAVANGLSIAAGAVFNVIFPRISAQVAAEDEHGVGQSYHGGTQLMAVLILPPAALLSLFSFEVLRLWTRSSETAAMTAPILRVLAIGSALNALLFLPYALQLAFGWTKLNLVAGLVSICIAIPVMFPITKYFGPVGAATVWAALNILNMLVVVPIMHRCLLPGEVWGYFGDIGWPFLSVIGTAVLGRVAFPGLTSPGITVAVLASVWFGSSVMAVVSARRVRSWTLAWITSAWLRYVRESEALPKPG